MTEREIRVTARQVGRLRELRAKVPAFCGLFARVYDGAAGIRAAVRCRCLECQGFDRVKIETCDRAECTLWRFRPYQDDGR